jgi:DNA repair protein RadC
MATENHTSRPPAAERAIRLALRILEAEARSPGAVLDSPDCVRDYLKIKIGFLEHEVFVAMWMDAQHRVIEIEELFRGTITQTSVHPREVAKSALRFNAAAVIFAHNHPSGTTEPSRADELLTNTLKRAMSLLDVNVLDHFVVSGVNSSSFAERGLL